MQKKYTSSSTPRLLDRQGSLKVMRLGSSTSWSDLYHRLLKLSWGSFLTLIPVSYLTINAIFALLYLVESNGIENAKPGSFRDAFFFSVQTMSSIGYGAMYPKTPYANTLVVIEALVGLLITAVFTGLVFARFSLPTAKVIFTKVAVVDRYNGVPTLMLRAANQRGNFMLEAQVRVSLVRNEITQEGNEMRRFYDLKLVRSRSPAFALTWTVMHHIDENSPLYGETPESLQEKAGELVVILTGIDETLSQTVHARCSYLASEIFWDMQFVDILSSTPDGKRRVIDMRKFHDVMSL